MVRACVAIHVQIQLGDILTLVLYIRTHNIEDKLSLVLATVVALIYDHLTSQNIILFIWGNIYLNVLQIRRCSHSKFAFLIEYSGYFSSSS